MVIKWTSTEDLVDRPGLGLEQEPEDKAGDEERQQPGDDNQRAGQLVRRKLRLNSSASPKPMRNWKSSDSTVKLKRVGAMALCVTDWVSVAL